NVMLIDPVVSEGQFFMTKPAAIRWEYSSPESMQFIIESDTYTGYFPERKMAETKNIRRWSDHLFRFFGLGQGSGELKKFYRIQLASQQPEDEILLILEPKRKRARRKVERVNFWINPKSFMPSRIEYATDSGNGRLIVFESIQINPDLAANLYQIDLPSDVEVTNGFSGLPDFDASSAQ
ncbi:MAG: outer membrane lipoprotein carrier protein LolA, partial [Acidobacteriota bacterium]|nr:outer membrane lipoprotein carrier protein LolA [Acidobacteriota bacterium]